MIREELEYFLKRGDAMAFAKETDSADYLGYILLTKQKPNDRFLALLKPGENPGFAEKQELIRRRPYHVLVQEMRRDVYERGECESSADYRLTEKYRFASLSEVQEFLDQFSLKLEDIRWAREIPGA